MNSVLNRILRVAAVVAATTLSALAATITHQPESVAVSPGQAATFSVVATGVGPVRYQWRHQGSAIAGAEGPSLTIPAVEPFSAGFYDVVVTDDSGALASSAASLRVSSALRNEPHRLDLSFAPLITATSSTYAMPEVRSLATAADGKIYVAGKFVVIAGGRRSGLARFRTDLTLDSSFAPEVLGDVEVVVVQPDGRVLIGGAFTHVAGLARKNLARLNTDGTLDTGFGTGAGCDGVVRSIVLQPDGRVLVGGEFTHCEGIAANRIARVLSTGAVDGSFQPGEGCDGAVLAIALQPDGRILIAGRFRTVMGSERVDLARLEAGGGLDLSFAPPPLYGGLVHAVAVQPTGKILLGRPNGEVPVTRLNSDGTLDRTFVLDPIIDNFGFTAAIRLAPDGAVYVAGLLGNNADAQRRYLFRLQPDGAIDAGFRPVETPRTSVQCLEIESDGRILVGGFVQVGEVSTAGFARYATSGALAGTVGGAFGVPGSVSHVAPAPGGKWYIAGEFHHVDGLPRNRIARLNADGSVDPAFDPGAGFSAETTQVAVAGDGKVLVGGNFSEFDGRICEGVARLLPDGRIDSSFVRNSWTGFLTRISRFCIQADGRILVAGGFSSFNNAERRGLVRLNPDGSSDTAFNSGRGFYDTVSDLAVRDDGRILVASTLYDPVADQYHYGVVQLRPDGARDTAFLMPADTTVRSLGLLPDGHLLASGYLPGASGSSDRGLARVDPSGGIDASFGFSFGALTLCFPDGGCVVSGSFSAYNGTQGESFLRLRPDGQPEPGFAVYDFGGALRAKGFEVGDGRFLLTGTKAGRGSHVQYGVAMFKPDLSPVPVIVVAPTSQVASVGGEAVLSVVARGDDLEYQWFKDGLPMAGATQSVLRLSSLQPGTLGSFTVRISNALGSATSTPVQVTGPYPAPTINQAPSSQKVVSGSLVTFMVQASGAGSLQYQWRRSGEPIAGATDTTLRIDAAQLSDAGFYDVVVNDGLSSTSSPSAELTVLAPKVAPIYRMDPSFSICLAQAGQAEVRALAVQTDGSVVVGGSFAVYRGQPRHGLARLTATMELDPDFKPVLLDQYGNTATATSVLLQPDGLILVGGTFATVNGITQRGLVRLNADGSVDPTFDFAQWFPYASVDDLVLQPDGCVLVVGSLGVESYQTRQTVVRLLSTGALDSGFTASSTADGVKLVALAPDGRIYAGGAMKWLTQNDRAKVVRLKADGSLDASFAAVTSMGSVSDLVVQTDGRLLVGGSQIAMNLWRYLPDGTPDASFSVSGDLDAYAVSLLVQTDGRILVGRYFPDDPHGKACLLRLNADGTADPAFAPAAAPNAGINVLCAHPAGGVLAGGRFTRAGVEPAAGLVRLDGAGGLVGAPTGPCGANGTVSRALRLPGNKVLLVGSFTHVGVVARAGAAVLNADGTVDPAFDPGAGFGLPAVEYFCSELLRDGAGRILVRGTFSSYDGVACNGFLRILPDGKLDHAFMAGLPWGFSASAMLLGPRGELYVATRRGAADICRLLDSGVSDPAFVRPQAETMATVGLHAVQPDGRLIVTIPDEGLQRLNPDGSRDLSFDGSAVSPHGVEWSRLRNRQAVADGGFLVDDHHAFLGRRRRQLLVERPGGESLLPEMSDLAPSSYPWSGNIQLLPLDDGRLLVAGLDGRRGAVRTVGLGIVRPEAVSPAPVFLSQPAPQTVVEGQSVAFSAVAAGEGALSYRWGKDGNLLPEGTAASYSIGSTQMASAGTYKVVIENDFGSHASGAAQLTVLDRPALATHPVSQSTVDNDSISLSFVPLGSTQGFRYRWLCNGAEIVGADGLELKLTAVHPAQAGLYSAEIAYGTKVTRSRPAVVGVVPPEGARTAGAVETRAEWQGIRHPNGNIYDQFLLVGQAGTITAAPGRIARISLVDEQNNIVQFEMSGPGALTVVLDRASGPAAPALYNQPGIEYMRGAPVAVLVGAEATTHMSVYSVGRLTNPGVTRDDVVYDGWANVQAVGIGSVTGGFGGLYCGNVFFASAQGPAGIAAPSVRTIGTLNLNDIATTGEGWPMILLEPEGQAAVKITGGSLAQPGGNAVEVSGLDRVLMVSGQGSSGQPAPAQPIRGRLVYDGVDITWLLIDGP